MAMNSNHKRLNWYFDIHLRSVLKIIFLNGDTNSIQHSIGFVAILAILLLAAISCVYTYANAKELSVSPMFAMGTFIGLHQVSSF